LGAWANVRGMVATASAMVANIFVFIFFSPCGPSARLQFHIALERPRTR
jgi:hypothetical protein